MTYTVAAVDCGTNSIRLLVLRADGVTHTELAREVRLARLGQGVDATGEFHPDALARTFAICDEFAQLIAEHSVDEVRFVATSAARDAKNRDEFFAGVQERLGVTPQVITGDEEAELSAAGVAAGVQAQQPMLVIDIGGGSTELVCLDDGVRHAVSLNIGAVRMKERFLHDDPPTQDQVAQARRFVGVSLDQSGTPFAEVQTAVGVAGTVTSVAATVLELQEYSRDAVHGVELTRDQIHHHCERWLAQPSSVTEQEPCMPPLRASVIGAGALILDEIAARVPSGSVLVSETDILDGIALAMLQ